MTTGKRIIELKHGKQRILLELLYLLPLAFLLVASNAPAQQEQTWLWNAGGVQLALPSN
jgi:hypothetical protein